MKERKVQSAIMLTETNKRYLKDNAYKNNENFSECINRLIDTERKRNERKNN